ncbi:MAG: ATPase domain-containing protein [Nanoarchaeota archaeon]
MLKTNIEKLDNQLNGGFKEKTQILISSSPGIRDLDFTLSMVYSFLKQNKKVLFITIDQNQKSIKNKFFMNDLNIDSYEKNKKIDFIDLYKKIIEKEEIEDIDHYIQSAIIHNKDHIIVFNSLSSILDIFGTGKKTINFIQDWIKLSKKQKVTTISLFINWPYKKNITTRIKSLFNTELNLKLIEKQAIIRNYFHISKLNNKIKKSDHTLFEILQPGGIKEYIPKLLVTGPFNSGKTTFTHAISTKATSVDRLGTTIALDYGHLNYKSYTADVFGTPGQTRFDPLLKMLGKKAIGLFLILDSTKPESFPRAEEMIKTCNATEIPYVVIANKQDLKEALSINKIRNLIKLPKKIPIIPTVANKKKGLNKALDSLFNQISD